MHGLLLVFCLHVGDEHAHGDKWFSADKAKHFFMAAFVQTATFGSLRSTGLGRPQALAGASVVSAGVSIGKEIHDFRSGGTPSKKDLAWDTAGIIAASSVLVRTAR